MPGNTQATTPAQTRSLPAVTAQPSSAAAAPATASVAIAEYTDANGNRILGSPNAPVTLTDYSDFL